MIYTDLFEFKNCVISEFLDTKKVPMLPHKCKAKIFTSQC